MNMKEVRCELFCSKCFTDSIQTIVYINDIIYSTKCDDCKQETILNPNLADKITEKYISRVFSKPERIKNEIEGGLIKTITSLPSRFVTKPFRLYKEVHGLRTYVYKKRNKKAK